MRMEKTQSQAQYGRILLVNFKDFLHISFSTIAFIGSYIPRNILEGSILERPKQRKLCIVDCGERNVFQEAGGFIHRPSSPQ